MMLVYREAKRAGKVSVNPARDLRHRREDNSRVRYLMDEENQRLREIVNAKYPWHMPKLEIAVHTGLRQGSQYGLTWDMVDWDARMLHVPRTKNEEPLHIPLNDVAVDALKVVRSEGLRTGGYSAQSGRGSRWSTRATGSSRRSATVRSLIFTGMICGTRSPAVFG